MATASGNVNQKLSGINPLSYMGVEATTPPQMILSPVAPTPGDAVGFQIGTYWLVTTVPEQLWVLLRVVKNVATWAQLFPAAGGSFTFVTDAGIAVPVLGVTNILGGNNITTSAIGNTITIDMDSDVVTTLTGNSGGPVPALAENINTVADNTIGLTTVGSPGTNTLTVTTLDGNPIGQSLTGNSGGLVNFAVGGNINLVGDGTTVTVVGTPLSNTLTISAVGTGTVETLTGDSGGPISPTAGNINIVSNVAANNAGASISFSGAASTLTFNDTDALGNIFIGKNAGNTTLTGTSNLGIGSSSTLSSLTTGQSNTVINGDGSSLTTGSNNSVLGFLSFLSATTASGNTILGNVAAGNLLTGTGNIVIGAGSGSAMVAAESDNIYIRSPGAAESHTIRIGTQGGGVGQQNRAFLAGVNGVTTGSPTVVTIDTVTNQLGVTSALPTFTTGTFVPTVTFGGASTGITYSRQTGMYTKIGTTVWIGISIILTSKGSSTGVFAITGLPFTVGTGLLPAYNATMSMEFLTLDATYTQVEGVFTPGGTSIIGVEETPTGATLFLQLTDTNFANNTAVGMYGFYSVT